MTQAVPMTELWRGGRMESQHLGHAVICDDTGQIVQAWGDPDAVIYPRSSCKMVQALPLIESGAADAARLTDKQLALACASHQGAYIHTDAVRDWLDDLGLNKDDLRCGPQKPSDKDALHDMIRAGGTPCQTHNNCSGKHTGFLTLNKHIGGGAEYIADGATRGSECAIAAILIKLGVLDANHPAALKRHNARVLNWRGVDCGVIQSAAGFPA